MTPELRLQLLRGAEIRDQTDALAGLRIEVFRDWPYLYQGTMDYEEQYLQPYIQSSRSLVVLAWHADRCIGASTCLPLADAAPDLQQPFRDGELEISTIHYFGESVLDKAYRGRGIGVEFFRLREAHAREQALTVCAFCAVERDRGDPRRPAGYVDNEAFWRRRGYRQHPGLQSHLSWPDIGQAQASLKPMTFWIRRL